MAEVQEPESDRTTVVLARKSYDHLLRTRDRALREAEWERERTQDHRRWAERSLDEQRRLVDRLNSVCTAAAALGVSIQAINAALAEVDGMRTAGGDLS
jgi:phage baseplate assembly protein gpV